MKPSVHKTSILLHIFCKFEQKTILGIPAKCCQPSTGAVQFGVYEKRNTAPNMSVNFPEFSASEEKAAPEAQPKAIGIKQKSGGLKIGIPREITFQENRVALTPSSVSYLTANGHQVVVESGAGKASHFSDTLYSEAGAEICAGKEDVYHCDILLKIDPPTAKEIDLMHPGQLIISALQLDQLDELLLRRLMDKRVNFWRTIPVLCP
jgi:hypothetical protein